MTVAGAWLSPAVRAQVDETETVDIAGVSVSRPTLSPADLRTILADVRHHTETVLRQRPVDDIIAVLDAASAAWLDPAGPERRAALALLPMLTGFSPEMVDLAIDLEMKSSREADLRAVLASELGPGLVGALDAFVPCPRRPGRRVRALGPTVTGAVFSSNIPALPHLSVMRALLLKSGFVGRSASAEPVFLPLYLQTLHRLDPALARCCAALSWPRERTDLEQAFVAGIDAFVGWGGVEAERHFEAVVPRSVPMVFHGHRLGFVYLAAGAVRGDLAPLAAGIARDVATFDQHACLSPHVVFVDGRDDDADRVGAALADALQSLSHTLPPRTATDGRRAAVSQQRLVAEMEGAMTGGRMWQPDDHGPGWTVVRDTPAHFPVSPLDRWVTVVPVAGVEGLLVHLRPLAGRLQNAALAVPDPEAADRLREQLARLGVSRFCPPGAMATPSMVWHHDGQACVGAFVRWSDVESVAPGDLCPLLDRA